MKPLRAGRRAPAGTRRAAAVEVTIAGGVAWLTLARAATGNRLDAETMTALVDAAAVAEDADEAVLVVLRARGPVFCAGLPEGLGRPERGWPDGVAALASLTKPVLVALQGEARGWGVALALAGDLRLAATSAGFVLAELAAGRLPGGGAIVRLTRIVGPARAMELILLGRRLPAARAVEWGLVNAVVPGARLGGLVAATARSLAARGPLALRLAKEAVLQALDLPLAHGIRLEQDLYVLLQTTADRGEGIRAFLDRRQPRFAGR